MKLSCHIRSLALCNIAQAVNERALKDWDWLGEQLQNLFAWEAKSAVSFHLVKKLKEERLAELLTGKLLFFCVLSAVLAMDNTAYI